MCNYVYKFAIAGVSSSCLILFLFRRRGWGKPLAAQYRRETSSSGCWIIVYYSPLLIIRWLWYSPSIPTLSSSQLILHVRKTALLMLIYLHSGGVSLPNNGILRKCRCPPTTIVLLDSLPITLFCADFVFPTPSTNIVYVLTFAEFKPFFSFT